MALITLKDQMQHNLYLLCEKKERNPIQTIEKYKTEAVKLLRSGKNDAFQSIVFYPQVGKRINKQSNGRAFYLPKLKWE